MACLDVSHHLHVYSAKYGEYNSDLVMMSTYLSWILLLLIRAIFLSTYQKNVNATSVQHCVNLLTTMYLAWNVPEWQD